MCVSHIQANKQSRKLFAKILSVCVWRVETLQPEFFLLPSHFFFASLSFCSPVEEVSPITTWLWKPVLPLWTWLVWTVPSSSSTHARAGDWLATIVGWQSRQEGSKLAKHTAGGRELCLKHAGCVIVSMCIDRFVLQAMMWRTQDLVWINGLCSLGNQFYEKRSCFPGAWLLHFCIYFRVKTGFVFPFWYVLIIHLPPFLSLILRVFFFCIIDLAAPNWLNLFCCRFISFPFC